MWSTKRSSKVQEEDTSHLAYFADHRPADPQATDFSLALVSPSVSRLILNLTFSHGLP